VHDWPLTDFCQICLAAPVSLDACDQIGKLRRKIQRVGKTRVVFLDEVAVKLNEGENYTLVLPGEKEYITVTNTTCMRRAMT
jgi:hypothetical protein